MQHLIHIRDELVLEAHLDADEPHILLRREGEPGAVRVVLGDVRYLISALGSMVAERTGVIIGEGPQAAVRVWGENLRPHSRSRAPAPRESPDPRHVDADRTIRSERQRGGQV